MPNGKESVTSSLAEAEDNLYLFCQKCGFKNREPTKDVLDAKYTWCCGNSQCKQLMDVQEML